MIWLFIALSWPSNLLLVPTSDIFDRRSGRGELFKWKVLNSWCEHNFEYWVAKMRPPLKCVQKWPYFLLQWPYHCASLSNCIEIPISWHSLWQEWELWIFQINWFELLTNLFLMLGFDKAVASDPPHEANMCPPVSIHINQSECRNYSSRIGSIPPGS